MPELRQRRSASPRAVKPTPSKAKKASKASSKGSVFGTYQSLVKRFPQRMNFLQTCILCMAGNATAQALVGDGPIALRPIVEQGALGLFLIAPIMSLWLPFLSSLKLHWVAATAIDQFIYSPLINIVIFWFIFAFFKGGIGMGVSSSDSGDHSLVLSLHTSVFPSVWTYEPMMASQVTSYWLWLPATIVREVFVPAHLAPLFMKCVTPVEPVPCAWPQPLMRARSNPHTFAASRASCGTSCSR